MVLPGRGVVAFAARSIDDGGATRDPEYQCQGGAMPGKLLDITTKLLVASLGVGFVLSLFDINPWAYAGRLGPLSQDAVDLGTGLFRWAWTYVIRGAAVIVPLWLIYPAAPLSPVGRS
jgi:hypothetical protein